MAFLDASGVTALVTKLKSYFALASHNHSASNITSGTLGVARGGTGAATHTSNAVLTGNGTSAVKNVATKSGALYATSSNGAASFGTLPVAQGGTGSTSAANARTALDAAQANGATTTLYAAEQAIAQNASDISTLQDSVSISTVSCTSTNFTPVFFELTTLAGLAVINFGGTITMSGTNIIIGNVPSGYAPSHTYNGVMQAGTINKPDGDYTGYCYVGHDKTIHVMSENTMSNGTYVTGAIVYPLPTS